MDDSGSRIPANRLSPDGTIIPSMVQKAAQAKMPDTEYLSAECITREPNTTTPEPRNLPVAPPDANQAAQFKEAIQMMQDEILGLVTEEFSRMEKELEILSRRVEELEREKKDQA